MSDTAQEAPEEAPELEAASREYVDRLHASGVSFGDAYERLIGFRAGWKAVADAPLDRGGILPSPAFCSCAWEDDSDFSAKARTYARTNTDPGCRFHGEQ